MNVVILTGNIGNEIDLRTTPSDKKVCSFSLAVRESKDETIWVNIVAWNKTAEILDKYAHKGSKIAVNGRLSIRNYNDKEGNKKYVTEVIANSVELLDSKGSNNSDGSYKTKPQSANVEYSKGTTENFEAISDTDDSLPF